MTFFMTRFLPPSLHGKIKLEKRCTNLLVLLINDFRFLVPLEPHHVLGVKPPALFL